MKSLILGDCDHLIKFILFGDEETDEIDENKMFVMFVKKKEKEKKKKKK